MHLFQNDGTVGHWTPDDVSAVAEAAAHAMRAEADEYGTPRDEVAYARQSIVHAYSRMSGPRAMREAGRLFVEYGDAARCEGRKVGAGPTVDFYLERAGIPYAPQMELF